LPQSRGTERTRTLIQSCAAGLLFSIQMWVSLRSRSFRPGLVVAVIALALMFIAIPRGAAFFGSLFPWSLPAVAMAPVNPYRPLAVGLGLLGGAVVGAVACWGPCAARVLLTAGLI
jgi:hypothetical protein